MASFVVLRQQGLHQVRIAGAYAGKHVGLFQAFVEALDVVGDDLRGVGDRTGRRYRAGRQLLADGAVGEQDPFEDAVFGHQFLAGRGQPGARPESMARR